MCRAERRGFTLIELLIVIAIIGILSATVLMAMNEARAKARDTQRRQILEELSKASELRFHAVGSYPGTAGWFTNPGHGGLDAALTPTYVSAVQDDPINGSWYVFQYWRKDTNMTARSGASCATVSGGSSEEFAFYARLEKPTASDLATFKDAFDLCVRETWGLNYKKGN